MIEQSLDMKASAATAMGGRRALMLIGIFLLASMLLIDVGANLFDAPPVHHQLGQWLKRQANDDSWEPMIQAYTWLRASHQGTLYQEIFFSQHVKFQYPPTALLPLAAMNALGRSPSVGAFNAANWIIFIVVALATAALAVTLARRVAAIPRDSMLSAAAVGGVTALATMAFYPELWSYLLGQAQTSIDLAFVLACLSWISGRRLPAGVLIGLICLVKPQFGLFVVWGALRGQWRFLIGWCVVVVPALAASIALFGLEIGRASCRERV